MMKVSGGFLSVCSMKGLDKVLKGSKHVINCRVTPRTLIRICVRDDVDATFVFAKCTGLCCVMVLSVPASFVKLHVARTTVKAQTQHQHLCFKGVVSAALLLSCDVTITCFGSSLTKANVKLIKSTNNVDVRHCQLSIYIVGRGHHRAGCHRFDGNSAIAATTTAECGSLLLFDFS